MSARVAQLSPHGSPPTDDATLAAHAASEARVLAEGNEGNADAPPNPRLAFLTYGAEGDPSDDAVHALIDEIDHSPARFALKFFRLCQFVKAMDTRLAALEDWRTNLPSAS